MKHISELTVATIIPSIQCVTTNNKMKHGAAAYACLYNGAPLNGFFKKMEIVGNVVALIS